MSSISTNETKQQSAGFTRAYNEAAKKGTADLDDAKAAVKIHHVIGQKIIDPTLPFRQRVAFNLAQKLQQSSSFSSRKCLDVGCAIGNDLNTLKEALQNDKILFEPYGVDLLGAQLGTARECLPEGNFTEANVLTGLPFQDKEMDSVQCSRLLIHIPDMSKAIDEMLRILRPGGCGVFAEGNFYGHFVYTSDERLQLIETKRNQHTIKQCANPGSAMDAYKILLTSRYSNIVENVKIEPWNILLSDPSYGLGMAYLKPAFEALVNEEIITQDDMDYYFQTLTKAQNEGNYLISVTMFEVSFDKKM